MCGCRKRWKVARGSWFGRSGALRARGSSRSRGCPCMRGRCLRSLEVLACSRPKIMLIVRMGKTRLLRRGLACECSGSCGGLIRL